MVPDDDHRPHWNSTASMSGTDEWRYEMLLVAQIEKLFFEDIATRWIYPSSVTADLPVRQTLYAVAGANKHPAIFVQIFQHCLV